MEGEKVRKFEIRKNSGGDFKNLASREYYGSSENTPDSYSSEENIARKKKQ